MRKNKYGDVKHDINVVLRLIKDQDVPSNYSEIYDRTNEDLYSLYSKIDIKDKNVLSVLSSSDQIFMARYFEAKTIDSFDKNKLTLYYYYLRIWFIKYLSKYYPKLYNNDYEELNYLLNFVEVNSSIEKNALTFWKTLNEKKINFVSLFKLSYHPKDFSFVMNKDICGDIIFNNFDFFDNINNDKTYDIIIFSNILDWAGEDNNKLKIARNNIYKLLNNNGIVLCSKFIYNLNDFDRHMIFSSLFDYEDFDDFGYAYVKR